MCFLLSKHFLSYEYHATNTSTKSSLCLQCCKEILYIKKVQLKLATRCNEVSNIVLS